MLKNIRFLAAIGQLENKQLPTHKYVPGINSFKKAFQNRKTITYKNSKENTHFPTFPADF